VIAVTLWSGVRVVRALDHDEAEPTQEELDAIATAHLGANDGVRPNVRVLEQMTIPRPQGVGSAGGPAGAVPR
jgi:hypothetical protein